MLIASCLPILANEIDNVVVRQNVSKSNREELARRLRAITGWTDLAFDGNGAMRVGHAGPRAGSQSARDLLNKAFTGKRVILFEDASSRKDVVFCRVVLGTMDQVTSSEVYAVLIDFADFRQVTGDKQALAAFDVGWAVLHEIDHVVEDYTGPAGETLLATVKDHINRMRRELGLPVRNSYFFSFLPVKNEGTVISRFVRLGFDQHDAASTKRKRYWLIWDAAVVGGLTPDEKLTGLSDFIRITRSGEVDFGASVPFSSTVSSELLPTFPEALNGPGGPCPLTGGAPADFSFQTKLRQLFHC